MAVLQALGIDSTLLYQFILASFCFFALSALVFKPYADAYFEREKRTKGGEEEAIELTKQAADLRTQYEQKARELNSQIKSIFDSYREESGREQSVILAKARSESQKVMDQTRQEVASQINEATKRMKDEVPQLAQAMTAQLLSKKA